MDFERLTDLFREKDLFAKFLGIRLEEIAEGYARASLELRPEHYNGLGIAHGGAIFALADLVFAAASNSHGTAAVAVNADISFVKAVSRGRLRAEAREISRGSRLGTYRVEVLDESGSICAVFQGTVYRRKQPLLPSSEAGAPRE